LGVIQHGELFTQQMTVTKMSDIQGIRETCEYLIATFLESVESEGASWVAILRWNVRVAATKYKRI
jgi:hypothetical protein